ncbi:MAG: amidohydrolase family protein [Planctomycetota bacterium]
MTIARHRSFRVQRILCMMMALVLFPAFHPAIQVVRAADEGEKTVPESPQKAEAENGKDENKQKEKKEEDRYFALLGGDVFTITGPVMEETDILVKNGIIHALGPNLVLPDPCESLDVRGMKVYPGLIAVASSGILGREPPENSTDLFAMDMVLGLAGGLTTVVTGTTAAKLTYGTTENMILKRNVFTSLNYTRNQPMQRQEMWNDFRLVEQYLRDLDAYETSKSMGLKDLKEPDKKQIKGKLENYLKLMTGEATALVNAATSQQILDVCELAQAFGFKLVINNAFESWIVSGEIGRAGAQVILIPRQKADPDESKSRPTGSNIETARILYDHGVNFTLLPERTGISLGGITGRDLLTLPMEAAFAVRGGLPAKAAIEAITINAARMLGLDKRIGSIEKGKDADLIVCDGDLLHYNTLVQWTVVNGRVAYDKEKETLFSHIRPREPSKANVIDFWPRPFGEMPDYDQGTDSTDPAPESDISH